MILSVPVLSKVSTPELLAIGLLGLADHTRKFEAKSDISNDDK